MSHTLTKITDLLARIFPLNFYRIITYEQMKKTVLDIAQNSFSYNFLWLCQQVFPSRSLLGFFFALTKISRDLEMKRREIASGVKFNVNI